MLPCYSLEKTLLPLLELRQLHLIALKKVGVIHDTRGALRCLVLLRLRLRLRLGRSGANGRAGQPEDFVLELIDVGYPEWSERTHMLKTAKGPRPGR